MQKQVSRTEKRLTPADYQRFIVGDDLGSKKN